MCPVTQCLTVCRSWKANFRRPIIYQHSWQTSGRSLSLRHAAELGHFLYKPAVMFSSLTKGREDTKHDCLVRVDTEVSVRHGRSFVSLTSYLWFCFFGLSCGMNSQFFLNPVENLKESFKCKSFSFIVFLGLLVLQKN